MVAACGRTRAETQTEGNGQLGENVRLNPKGHRSSELCQFPKQSVGRVGTSPRILYPSKKSRVAGSSISNIIKVVSELQISSWRSKGNPKQAGKRSKQSRFAVLLQHPGNSQSEPQRPRRGCRALWIRHNRSLTTPRAAIRNAHALGIVLSYLIKQSLFSHFLVRQLLAQ